MARLSKAEKRAALRAAKEAARREKQVRVIEDPAPAAHPIAVQELPAGKAVRIAADPSEFTKRQMRWNVDRADRVGAWTWGVSRAWEDAEWTSEIEPKLRSFSSMTWNAILQARSKAKGGRTRASHHDMEIGTICDEAQTRAAEIELGQDVLFRFRCGGAKRLWGYRLEEHFFVVWWDPTHQIYPVEVG